MIFPKFLITVVLCCCFSLDNASCKPLTDGLTPCKKTDPKLNECLLDILKRVKPQLFHGVPELNLPSLDPLYIPKVSIHGTRQDIRMTGELYNLTAKGSDSMTVKTLNVDLAENTWDMTVDIPLVMFVTDFNLNITLKALYVPIYGKGRCHGKISHSVVRFHANTEVKDNKLKLKNIKMNLYFEDVDVHITNTQNPTIAQTASEFFNTNKRLVLDLITPIAEDAATDLLVQHGNRILSTMEITDLLVD
ncbi:Haemolymph juvenile hormone binding [Cinara cedri]|uniref:Haemolymph juvenile hormone binding n=1 Tax=Cinara cedri TaxID=506608 RepID=A0A5E4MS04_9HEMI|nr:Haemolymph juvenile hormone binding [Cinara cedri]